MTNNPFEREKKAQFKRFVADVRQTRADIDVFLKKAKEKIRSRLATAPSDYQMWALTNVQKDIERVAEELKSDLRSVGNVGFDKAVETGAALVDEPVKAMFKFDLNARVQRADTEQIKAMRSFMTDRLADIGEQAKKKISEQMGLCLIGAQNPFQAAREIAAHLDANWADKILNRAEGTYPDGTSKTVGVIDAGILQALKVRGIEPFSADISITDKRLIHLSRAVKQARGQQVDLNTIKHLPDRLANAEVVLRSKNKNELIYAFKRPDGLYDKVAVNLQRKEDNAKNAQSRNWIVTAGKMEEQNLRNENAYEILKEK